jgi:hypothetical protein
MQFFLFVWVWNLATHIERVMQAESVWEKFAEKDTWA